MESQGFCKAKVPHTPKFQRVQRFPRSLRVPDAGEVKKFARQAANQKDQ